MKILIASIKHFNIRLMIYLDNILGEGTSLKEIMMSKDIFLYYKVWGL